MDQKRIVEVHVATPATQATGVYEFATGYLIGRDSDGKGLILTTGHVLDQGSETIEVRFRHMNQPKLFFRCDWARDFRPELDVAVLHMVDVPPGDVNSGEPLFEPSDPPRDKDAEGAGYPQLTNEPRRDANGLRELTSLRGRFEVLDQNQSIVAWNATLTVVRDSTGWKGISGAPVFADNRLVGVIAEHDQAFSTTRLRVVPSRRLLENPRFRGAICWFERDVEIRVQIKNNLISVLENLESPNLELRVCPIRVAQAASR